MSSVPGRPSTPQERINAAFSAFAPQRSAQGNELHSAVGPGRSNWSDDVRVVQRLLNLQAARTGVVVRVNGQFDRETRDAIEAFERRVMRSSFPRGVVEPGSAILRQLENTRTKKLVAGRTGALQLPPRTGPDKLTEDDLVKAADELNCEVRAIKAVTRQEAPKGPFDVFDRPTILFERHLFQQFTFGRYYRVDQNISSPFPGQYGLDSQQYDRLTRAYALDDTAALRAASWGAFQILGNNFIQCGFSTVDLFVDAMCQSVQDQLQAFVAFIKYSPAMTRALQRKEWAKFASMYNGPQYQKNHYDTNLELYYEQATP
jgi:hypothetical protein